MTSTHNAAALTLGLGFLRKPTAKNCDYRRSLTLMKARQQGWKAQYSRRVGAMRRRARPVNPPKPTCTGDPGFPCIKNSPSQHPGKESHVIVAIFLECIHQSCQNKRTNSKGYGQDDCKLRQQCIHTTCPTTKKIFRTSAKTGTHTLSLAFLCYDDTDDQ